MYCALEDVKSEFKALKTSLSGDSGITDLEIEGFIEQASAQMDLQLANCFLLPIADIPANKTTLINLKTICIWLVVDRIIPILQVKSRNQNLDQAGQSRATYYQKAKSILDKICPASESGLVAPAKKESVAEVDSNEEQESYFERDRVQW